MRFSTILMIATALAGTTSASAKDVTKLGNGDYFVWFAPGGLPHVDPNDDRNQPARFSAIEFDQLQYLDADCHKQNDPMRPSMFKSIGLTIVRNAPGIAIGTAAGAVWAFGTSATDATYAKQYGKYGGASGIGSAIGAGITSHEYGKHYLQGICMQTAVDYYRNSLRAMSGIRIIINPFAVNGHRIRRPADSGENTRTVNDTPVHSAHASEDDQNVGDEQTTMPPHP
jgi:hypothetical protein